jgi:hypothetical protein
VTWVRSLCRIDLHVDAHGIAELNFWGLFLELALFDFFQKGSFHGDTFFLTNERAS